MGVADDAKKAVSTVDLALAVIGIMKTGFVVFAMVLLDFARRKQRLAENQAAVATSDLSTKMKQDTIQKAADAKTADDIIGDFLGD